MEQKETFIRAIDGNKLYVKTWNPDGISTAHMFLIHGFSEHSGRYDDWIKKFVVHNIKVTTMDLRGHGRSEGIRGHAPSFNHLLDDMETLIKHEGLENEVPRFLYGHSLGGSMVLNYGLRRSGRITGIIATSPWLRLSTEPKAIASLLSRGLKIIAPQIIRDSLLDFDYLTHDQEMVKQYENDPLVHRQITPALFFSAKKAGIRAMKEADKLDIPLLLMHGTEDKKTSYKASEELIRKARNAGKDVHFLSWKGLYHELHHEIGKEKIFDSIIDWMNEKSKQTTL